VESCQGKKELPERGGSVWGKKKIIAVPEGTGWKGLDAVKRPGPKRPRRGRNTVKKGIWKDY